MKKFVVQNRMELIMLLQIFNDEKILNDEMSAIMSQFVDESIFKLESIIKG